MLFICKQHIKEGLKVIHVPHVKILKKSDYKCCVSGCDRIADYKLSCPSYLLKSHKRAL